MLCTRRVVVVRQDHQVPSDTFGLTYSFGSIGDIACDIHIRLKKWHLVTSDAVSDKMRMPWSNNTQHAMLFTAVTVVEPCPHRTVGNHHPIQWAEFDKPASSINNLILQHCQDNVAQPEGVGSANGVLVVKPAGIIISRKPRLSWDNNTVWVVPKRRVEMRTRFSWLRIVYA